MNRLESIFQHPQRLAVAVVLLSALLFGCRGPLATTQEGRGANEPQAVRPEPFAAQPDASKGSDAPRLAEEMPPTASSQTPHGLEGMLAEGQAYADFRAAVMAKGWAARPNPQCRANVIGGDQAICVSNPELQVCKACDQMPELSSCSGDGYCGMYFLSHDGKQVLGVTTYGMTEDWNVKGDQSRLTVSGWKVE